MIDNASGDEGLLKEIFDYAKARKSDFKPYQQKFIFEHINEALENIEKKGCPTAKHFK